MQPLFVCGPLFFYLFVCFYKKEKDTRKEIKNLEKREKMWLQENISGSQEMALGLCCDYRVLVNFLEPIW